MGDRKLAKHIDHDRLFKELLETFFVEFMELFFPREYQSIDFEDLRFLKQELFTDVTAGDKHYVDLVIETKLKGETGLILVHLENQAQYQSNFAERMFIYFSKLYQKHKCPVLPIAIFSYDEIRDEPQNFSVKFPFLTVLDFTYYIVELKKKNWRDYIKQDNPVAAALLSKMGYSEAEKVEIKLEFLRMITRMKLDPAQQLLITGFFETYLPLSEEEELILTQTITNLDPKEANKMLEITTSWHEKGRAEGILEGQKEGQKELLIRQITKKFGILPKDIANEIKKLDADHLNNLGEAIFDLANLDDLKKWLDI